MKKVLVISNLYPSSKDPYYGTFVENFVQDLKQSNKIKKIDLCLIKGRSFHWYEKIYKYLLFYTHIIYNLFFHNYDLVYVHIITHAALPLRLVSFFKKLPIIFNVHGEDLITQTRLAAYFLKIATPLIEDSKLIVVPSCFFKEKFKDRFPNISQQKIYVSASGGVKDFFFDTNKSNIKSDIINLGYVSRIDRGKGWKTYLNAIKILQEKNYKIKGTIVGRGTEVSNMKDLITQLKLDNIHYVGPIAYKDLPSIYNKFDLFIFPTELEESLGLVGLEAMACKVPVIGSKIGGLNDYIYDGINGYLFEPSNAHDLANKIEKYISLSNKEKENFEKSAYELAQKYSSSVVSEKLISKILS